MNVMVVEAETGAPVELSIVHLVEEALSKNGHRLLVPPAPGQVWWDEEYNGRRYDARQLTITSVDGDFVRYRADCFGEHVHDYKKESIYYGRMPLDKLLSGRYVITDNGSTGPE